LNQLVNLVLAEYIGGAPYRNQTQRFEQCVDRLDAISERLTATASAEPQIESDAASVAGDWFVQTVGNMQGLVVTRNNLTFHCSHHNQRANESYEAFERPASHIVGNIAASNDDWRHLNAPPDLSGIDKHIQMIRPRQRARK
jgi:hypothetical protein